MCVGRGHTIGVPAGDVPALPHSARSGSGIGIAGRRKGRLPFGVCFCRDATAFAREREWQSSLVISNYWTGVHKQWVWLAASSLAGELVNALRSRFFSAPEGAPVVAALSGSVLSSGLAGGYGIAIELDHREPRRRTLYGHLSELYVKACQTVQQGDVIGRVGSTGLST